MNLEFENPDMQRLELRDPSVPLRAALTFALHHEPGDRLRMSVSMRADAERHCWIISASITNVGGQTAHLKSFVLGSAEIEWERAPAGVSYLHALNAKRDLPPLCPLVPRSRTPELGRSYQCVESIVLWSGHDQPCVVLGPLTQNISHRVQWITWDGDRRARVDALNEFRGLDARPIEPGESIDGEQIFVQFRGNGDLNEALADYLAALGSATGTRWSDNPLRSQSFFDPWNNYLYWEADAATLAESARLVRDKLPEVGWFVIDDGYQQSTVNPHLARRADGELLYDNAIEMVWYHNCPGPTFAFAGGRGVDPAKHPEGLGALAKRFRQIGLRPAIWIGMEASRQSQFVRAHPDRFLEYGHEAHVVPDVSLPEVRADIERLFQQCFERDGYEAIKLDFYSELFENPRIRYRNPQRSGAEWRRWFFQTLRKYLPRDGFVTLGVELAVGTPFLAPWVDSYRHSFDMRDGEWDNVKRNARWSVVPLLTHGHAQPIADSDTISLFKGLAPHERTCWADYAMISGTLVEASGNVNHWSDADVAWVRRYLGRLPAGERVYFAEPAFWTTTGLPPVIYRRDPARGRDAWLVCIANWSDQPMRVTSPDRWQGPIAGCTHLRDLRTDERFDCRQLGGLDLPPHHSRLLRATPDAADERSDAAHQPARDHNARRR